MPNAKKKPSVNQPPLIRYSPAEQLLLDLLPLNGDRVTTQELIRKRWAKEPPPFHAHHIITSTLRSLQRKVDRNGEKFAIMKSQRMGPYPIEVWVEKR